MEEETPRQRPGQPSDSEMKLLALLTIVVLLGLGCWLVMIRMPGKSHANGLPNLSSPEIRLREELRRHVRKLAGEIGERNLTRYEALSAAAEYLESELREAGYGVRREGFDVAAAQGPLTCYNLEAEKRGRNRAEEIVVIGAHYDSAEGTPGANDNATGVAATLALARSFTGRAAERTLRFVFFVNEEPPYFQTPAMGSLVYARGCRQRGENIVAMLSIETVGYFSAEPGSQRYPFPIGLFYPTTADFLGFVGNVGSRELVRRVTGAFRAVARVPSQGVAAPAWIPGVSWSDHWGFWQAGYPGVMVTDTALYRYPHYHSAEDTPDKIDYERFTLAVRGLEVVGGELAAGD